MFNKIVMICLLLFSSVHAAQIIKIDNIRGSYQLNFEDVYEIPIYPDIETMIAFPPQYTITLVMPGSPDYVSAHVVQNTIYLTRPVDHKIETNVSVHVVTPDGLEEKMVIRCVGPALGKKVLAVQFTRPNTSEVNRVVEKMKSRYTEQLSAELHAQEKELNNDIHEKTISDVRYLFINSSRKGRLKTYKGATVYLDGMVNSRDNTYIYIISTVKEGACDIVALDKVVLGKTPYDPVLISTKQLTENETYSCWSIPQIVVPSKKTKMELLIKIWSKIETLTAEIS